MYLDFYNFSREPFNITPDPAFLYLSPTHKEALGSVLCGCQMRKGFMVITGEVGTGKTTIIRSCLKHIDTNNTHLIYLFNPEITFPELIREIFHELGLVPKKRTLYAAIHQFVQYLIEEYRNDRNVILIVDEAQNMPLKTLETLRMLSNLETSQDKLLQIVLVGQPEFNEILNKKEMRQIKQRIAARATLRPLTPSESMEYAQHRLSLVSRGKTPIFTNGALRRIIAHSCGIPRVINILCHNALLSGYGYEKKLITPRIVKEVIAEYEGISIAPWSRWKKACLAGGAILLMAVLAFFWRKWGGADMASDLTALPR